MTNAYSTFNTQQRSEHDPDDEAKYVIPLGTDGVDTDIRFQVSAAGKLVVDVDTMPTVSVVVDTPDVSTFDDGIVLGTTLSSDTAWTALVTLGGTTTVVDIDNGTNSVLEVSYQASPTDGDGVSIDAYINPFTSKVYDVGIATKVSVRRYSGTPTMGYVIGNGLR